MKTLVCGDLHTKYHIFEKVKSLSEDYETVVFLGDYVDEWHSAPAASYNLVQSLIEWKKVEPKKVVLLLGNHDVSEWLGGEYMCSGYNYSVSSFVSPLFENNKKLFQVAYASDDILYTHAGVTKQWWKSIGHRKCKSADGYAKILNKIDLLNTNDKYKAKVLAWAGVSRGGSHTPSPMWADKSDLENDDIGNIIQVVGHTPVEHIIYDSNDDRTLIFCDTHSKTSQGKLIGDGALLHLEKDEDGQLMMKAIY